MSLFKKSFHHLDKETFFSNYNRSFRGNNNYFMTYANGKSAARVQPHLRPNGAHRWYNYIKIPKYDDLLDYFHFIFISHTHTYIIIVTVKNIYQCFVYITYNILRTLRVVLFVYCIT